MNEIHLRYLSSPEWGMRLEADLLPWIERVAVLGDDVLEIGPGPGLTTDILRRSSRKVTALEVDRALAADLSARLGRGGVKVVHGDAAAMNFTSDRFSAVTAFSVLHHVPTTALQDQVFREAFRVLTPGGGFFATDALDLETVRAAHENDVFSPLPPGTLRPRLETCGFVRIEIETGDYELRFVARKPG